MAGGGGFAAAHGGGGLTARSITAGLLGAGLALLVPLTAGAQQPARGQSPMAGSRVFGSAGCAACHSLTGAAGAIGPDLRNVSEETSFFGFAADLWNHLPLMRERMAELNISQPRLEAWEMGDLLAFLHSLGYFDSPGDVAAGRTMFREKRCVRCHQVEGVGGVLGPSLDYLAQSGSPIQVAAAMWNHGPSMTAAMTAAGIERPTFSSRQLGDLVAFLRSAASTRRAETIFVLPGDAAEGERFFTEQRCVQCHGLREREGRVGPALAGEGHHRSVMDLAAAMWNAEPAMHAAMEARGVPIPQIQAGDMANLVAYFYSVQYLPEEGSQVRGRGLLNTLGCLGCHRFEGRGRGTAPDLATNRLAYPAGLVAALWNHTLLDQPPAARATVWPQLTARELADLAVFFQETRSGSR